MLAECLPASLPSANLRQAVEQAVLEAIGRRTTPADVLPLVRVSCLQESGDPDSKAGWSFFVIERPASGRPAGSATREIIELCLYQE